MRPTTAHQKRERVLQFYFWNNLTIEQIDDALGVTCIALRVCYHQDGGAFLVQLGEQLHHLQTILGVEVTRGLVGKNQFGIHHHGTGNGYAPLLDTVRSCSLSRP